MPGEHVFVDESKRNVYLVAAAVVAPADLTGARTALRAMQLPGTRRVHFQAESDAFRRKFLAQISELQVTARVYTARERTDLDSRRRILTQLVGDLVTMGASQLWGRGGDASEDVHRARGPQPGLVGPDGARGARGDLPGA